MLATELSTFTVYDLFYYLVQLLKIAFIEYLVCFISN